MGHGMNGPKVAMQKAVKKGRLSRLPVMPTSGRAREAGSDGRYAMEPTSIRTSRSEKCAQATRGLIMLDNAAWKRCGGKPEGAPKSVIGAPGGKVDHSKNEALAFCSDCLSYGESADHGVGTFYLAQ